MTNDVQVVHDDSMVVQSQVLKYKYLIKSSFVRYHVFSSSQYSESMCNR